MRHLTRSVAFGLLALCGCGAQEVVTSGTGGTQSPIVNGARSPAVVTLSRAQSLAIGAVMVGSGTWKTNMCTGTLVGPDVVLTAAHCVQDDAGEVTPPDALAFAVGDDAARPVDSAPVASVVVHPSYDGADGTAHYDVAVLRLTRSIPAAQLLPFNCAPLARSSFVGRDVQTVGYGDTATAGSNNTRKYWAVEEAVALGAYDLTLDGHGEAGVCTGDSGGPALIMVDGAPRIVGVLSWGDLECGYEDHFARTDAHCDFITAQLRDTGPAAPVQGGGEAVTVEGVGFSAEEGALTLALVNQASVETLDVDVALDVRAARAIVDARPLDSLQALGAVAYVGTSALQKLKAHASN
jgi:secreted trypsin-like serine protease